VDVFRPAHDFRESITRYQVAYIYKTWVEKGRRPIKCSTIVEKCGGSGKVPSLQCNRASGLGTAVVEFSRLTGVSPRGARRLIINIIKRLSGKSISKVQFIEDYGENALNTLLNAGLIKIEGNMVKSTIRLKARRRRRGGRHAKTRNRA
jgi:hypothetical protein